MDGGAGGDGQGGGGLLASVGPAPAFTAAAAVTEPIYERMMRHKRKAYARSKEATADARSRTANDRILNSTLYEYAETDGTGKRVNVPVVSRGVMECPWPPSEAWAQTQVVLHTPGFVEYDDLMAGQPTWLRAFYALCSADERRAARYKSESYTAKPLEASLARGRQLAADNKGEPLLLEPALQAAIRAMQRAATAKCTAKTMPRFKVARRVGCEGRDDDDAHSGTDSDDDVQTVCDMHTWYAQLRHPHSNPRRVAHGGGAREGMGWDGTRG